MISVCDFAIIFMIFYCTWLLNFNVIIKNFIRFYLHFVWLIYQIIHINYLGNLYNLVYPVTPECTEADGGDSCCVNPHLSPLSLRSALFAGGKYTRGWWIKHGKTLGSQDYIICPSGSRRAMHLIMHCFTPLIWKTACYV